MDKSRCPFCGSDDLIVERTSTRDDREIWNVSCQSCGGNGPLSFAWVEAVKRWNERKLGKEGR